MPHQQRRDSPSPVQIGQSWPPYPPAEETELERALRLEEEKEAKRVSDDIDLALEAERNELRKRKEYIKVLLLGQAESGKSTILKQFQLKYAPRALQSESQAWRAVIQLNLVRTVNFILDVIAGSKITFEDRENAATYSSPLPSEGSSKGKGADTLGSLGTRLAPLRRVEGILASTLLADEPLSRGSTDGISPKNKTRASEVSIRGGSGWKALVKRKDASPGSAPDDLDNARQLLATCKDDIVALWSNAQVQQNLREQDISLREQSGFFLDDTRRIASADYKPTTPDILRARLQTIGVEEHTLVFEAGEGQSAAAQPGKTWLFYDVGGSKGQRAAWAPYFDDVNAMIFLCSMAGFNQTLSEDRSINRLLDSLTIWKTVCSSKLLSNVTFIMLLNKCDLLEQKLKAGEQFARYVRSFKEANDFKHVSEYLKGKFIAIHKSQPARKRALHVHLTCAIDILVMAHVIVRLREAILVENLMSVDLI
ncbi:hypothetical protein QCA50_013831 [Cerrena zonata]|uniref:G-alpha-domain-containing protein n=1 Tax=Cerrena zonata TaxID=2478898 RepID=A0AAW0FQ34_9APHY